MRRSEQIPYGVKDFKRIRLENRYYVDKTAFIRKMEARADFLFFVRPRRFGKSLLCETLRCYYDVAEKENFEKREPHFKNDVCWQMKVAEVSEG